MEIVSRAQWGARAPKSTTKLSSDKVLGLTTHYTAAEYDRVADPNDCPSRIRGIQSYHMNTKRWADIAYSWLFCMHGTIYEGRGWGVRTAANGTNYGNDHYYAACFLGADKEDRDDVTLPGREALSWLFGELKRRIQNGTRIISHSDLKATACPGNELRAWLRLGMPLPVPERKEPGRVIVNAPQVTILAHPTWDGYLQVCEDGGVFGFGNPPFYGSLGAVALNAPIVDADVTPSGLGYVMLGEDGGVFAFGDMGFKGGHGPEAENAPFRSITITPTGLGYYLGGMDGAVFAYGDAEFRGAVEFRG